jgi:uncharacterized repeat protein (TIGR01451 family)
MPYTRLWTQSRQKLITIFKFCLFLSCFIVVSPSVANGIPVLQIEPVTWNVIGLKSNNVSIGPDTFPVGARVCNVGDTAAENVTATFILDTPLNSFFSIQGSSAQTHPLLPPGDSFHNIGPTGPKPANCADFYWDIRLARNSGAFDTTQKYHIETFADSVPAVQTPANRELYVERLISQARNSVESISGPETVYVGNTYQYTIVGKTATQGYQQLVFFLNLPGTIFRILDISSSYSAPPAPHNTNNGMYADACGWNANVGSPNYLSCVGPANYPGGKAGGGPISTTYTVKVISAGNAELSGLIYDFSGSSYHYNSDFGSILNVTAINPGGADPAIEKTHSGNFTQGQTGAIYVITVTNNGSEPASGTVTVTDTIPAGLTATGISGPGWACSLASLTCTRSDSLASGASYPDITVTVSVSGDAPANVINTATVSGGDDVDESNNTAEDPTIIIPPQPDLSIEKTHSGNFMQGQTGAIYVITVTNIGSEPASGTVTVTDTIPAGLTATGISGPGWACSLASLTCTRSDSLASGASYPDITVTVSVAGDAPANVINTATVSGGGDVDESNNTAEDPTIIIPSAPDLSIEKTHSGNFTQGQTGAIYAITVTNNGSEPTSGTITVTDTIPAGLTATGISGPGWACSLASLTCTRSDSLASGASYPAITVTVSVSGDAPANVINTATVSGGGDVDESNNTAEDPTIIIPSAPPAVAVPTMNEWGMIVFIFLAGAASLYFLHQKGAKTNV